MTHGKRLAALLCVAGALTLAGCKGGDNNNSANGSAAATPGRTATPISAAGGETGVEKVKPAPGTGNVQGKVLYNGQPVEGIKVNLCEQFNQYFGDPCGGKNYTARTDKDGDYVITNVEPKVYKGLLVWVFDTDSYVFATSNYGISANTYEVTADKTLFVRPTSIFKSDLKLVSPKAGAKVSAQGLELKWEPYPEAAYYKFSLYPSEASVTSPYIKERVDGTSFAVAKPVPSGTYRFEVEAFNASDQKLAEGPDDYKFTVTDGTAQ
jgi:hypothetical protein